MVQVNGSGAIKLNQEAVSLAKLESRLAEIFKTRVYRFVFVSGSPNSSFGEIADVIDIAEKRVDYVSLLTPSVLAEGQSKAWRNVCLDANLPPEYLRSVHRR